MHRWNNFERPLRQPGVSRWTRTLVLSLLCLFTVLGMAPRAATAANVQPKTLSGKLTYDRVPSTLDNGLDFTAVVQKPIRNVRVALVEDKGKETNSGRELATTTSGEDGSYSFVIPDAVTRVRVRAFAQTTTPPLQVQDNTHGDAIYTMESAAIVTTTTATVKNLNAASGWGGSNYAGPRVAAPFACLDTLYTAGRAFLAVRPLIQFPLLPVNWSVDNRPEDGDVALGQIGTSHYNRGLGAIFILGKEDVDTDEFDAHVMIHEWGHYFENKLGRSDAIGGVHEGGAILDPRVAFGEGWGNALSAMIMFPDALYKDTAGVGQAMTGLVIDLETNGANDPNPGWFSEASVQTLLYDLFDPANESFDGVELGLGPIYDVMTGGQKTTPALTSIFSFITALKAIPGTSAATFAAIETLTTKSHLGPVQDEFGTGETNNGGNAANLPLYRDVAVDGAGLTLTFLGNVNNVNKLGANRYVRFRTADAGPMQVIATSSSDIALVLFEDGKQIARADDTSSGTEQLDFVAKANKTYIVTVQGFTINSSETYTASVRIASGTNRTKPGATAQRKTTAGR
jgi:hypothetical protein